MLNTDTSCPDLNLLYFSRNVYSKSSTVLLILILTNLLDNVVSWLNDVYVKTFFFFMLKSSEAIIAKHDFMILFMILKERCIL